MDNRPLARCSIICYILIQLRPLSYIMARSTTLIGRITTLLQVDTDMLAFASNFFFHGQCSCSKNVIHNTIFNYKNTIYRELYFAISSGIKIYAHCLTIGIPVNISIRIDECFSFYSTINALEVFSKKNANLWIFIACIAAIRQHGKYCTRNIVCKNCLGSCMIKKINLLRK